MRLNSQLRQPPHLSTPPTPRRLDNIHEDAIRNINIPTGEPFVYDFDANLRPIGEPDEHGFRGRFVGGERTPAAAPGVAAQSQSNVVFSRLRIAPGLGWTERRIASVAFLFFSLLRLFFLFALRSRGAKV